MDATTRASAARRSSTSAASSEKERKRRPCEACGNPVGNATIVAGGEFSDAALCMTCGTVRELDEVFEMIRKRRAAKG